MELGSSDQWQTAQGLNMATQEIGVETVQHTVRSTTLPLIVFTQRNFVANFLQAKCIF